MKKASHWARLFIAGLLTRSRTGMALASSEWRHTDVVETSANGLPVVWKSEPILIPSGQ
ncbi:hypothetical protein [Pseudomonas sp. FW306-2-11BA]|uniref:hypothetical protein n=1 Tax=Pseudomonas sp. FW306-2-11BA TaxID=2070662 RepID=UPI0013048B38|nr:hypothetical protein [Pseudomonas sp. FW306-2-11BA]